MRLGDYRPAYRALPVGNGAKCLRSGGRRERAKKRDGKRERERVRERERERERGRETLNEKQRQHRTREGRGRGKNRNQSVVDREGMPTKGERGKATDFSIAAIMAPRGPSFGHYHLQGIGNAAATANTSLECPTGKAFVASSALDHREFSTIFSLLSETPFARLAPLRTSNNLLLRFRFRPQNRRITIVARRANVTRSLAREWTCFLRVCA